MGAKKAPFYRVVVADSHFPRDGRFIEEIGTYNPIPNPAEIKINLDRANHWIKNGAQPTDTVRHLLKNAAARAAAAKTEAPAVKAPPVEAAAAEAPSAESEAVTAAE
jgi:small subunit ribosomal protein S16